MVRVLALVVLTLVAVGLALLLQRRRPDPPSAPSYRAPAQLDRNDFGGAGDRLLVALFSSNTCETCPRTWTTIEAVTAGVLDRVDVRRLDVQDEPEIHKRYRIDGVPTTVVADTEGVVVQAFFGPITEEQLQEALVVASGQLPPDPSSN